MPHKISFPGPLAGITLTAARKDETGLIQTQGFYSTEDGQLFIHRLEGLVQVVINKIAVQCGVTYVPVQIAQLLMVMAPDGSAVVYVNDQFRMLIACLPGTRLERGQAVNQDDILCYKRVDFEGIEIPPQSGVLFLFSLGWRKGLFFDYSGVPDDDEKSNEYVIRDFGPLFAEFMNRVSYQNRFSLTDDDWQKLFDVGLFPFFGLRHSLLDQILAHVQAGWDGRELSDKIYTDVALKVPSWLDSWRKVALLEPHIKFLETAIDRFLAKDFISCVSTLMPRVEGILRSHGLDTGNPSTRSNALAQITEDLQDNMYDVLLPGKFKEYLREVFFRGFEQRSQPGDPHIILSRNAIAHGIVGFEHCDQFQACICMLVLHHLERCINPRSKPDSPAERFGTVP